VLRYKPERRWVGLVERGEEGPVALVKAYRRSRQPGAAAGLRFATQASCGAPRLLGVAAKAGALASSWVPGVALSDVLARPVRDPAPMAEVGAALASLHRADPSGLESVRPTADPRAVVAAAAHVATVLPESGPAAARLSATLVRQLAEGSRPLGPRHGDFSPDQVVCGPTGVSLVDFDDAGVGDVAADLGHFAAALVAAELDGRLAGGVPPALFEELLSGYAAAGGSAGADLVGTHTAAALVRLAVEPFRLRQPDWPARTEDLLDAAQVWSTSGVVPC
jgi:aminoglycoside phosphotransferase (APT) family kinase protein